MRSELVPERGENRDEGALWRRLARRVALYTGGDSSSVPRALALELFASVRFTLEQGRGESLEERFADGEAVIRDKLARGKQLWKGACGSLPQVENLSLRDTLRSIGGFWVRYDYRFFAHQVPCDIDYQLGRPVPEDLQGIDYVNHYLEQLCMENRILNCFAPQYARALLGAYCRDYRGLLINLCESVAVNALGLTLVGGDVAKLNVTDGERALLAERFSREGPACLGAAAGRLCALLGLDSSAVRTYLEALADDLSPRIRQTSLEGIFLTYL